MQPGIEDPSKEASQEALLPPHQGTARSPRGQHLLLPHHGGQAFEQQMSQCYYNAHLEGRGRKGGKNVSSVITVNFASI